MSRSGTTVSRRGLITLAAALGVSGSGLSFDDKVAKDRYISLIKQDPMFKWVPPGNLHRAVYYTPMESQPLASRDSLVSVVYSVSDSSTIPSLVQLAQEASLANGFSASGKRDADGIIILLSIQAVSMNPGFSLIFRAPAS